MSSLKKSILFIIVLVMILPIFVLSYTTLLLGNPFTEQQWLSAIILSLLGMAIVAIEAIVSLEVQ